MIFYIAVVPIKNNTHTCDLFMGDDPRDGGYNFYDDQSKVKYFSDLDECVREAEKLKYDGYRNSRRFDFTSPLVEIREVVVVLEQTSQQIINILE